MFQLYWVGHLFRGIVPQLLPAVETRWEEDQDPVHEFQLVLHMQWSWVPDEHWSEIAQDNVWDRSPVLDIVFDKADFRESKYRRGPNQQHRYDDTSEHKRDTQEPSIILQREEHITGQLWTADPQNLTILPHKLSFAITPADCILQLFNLHELNPNQQTSLPDLALLSLLYNITLFILHGGIFTWRTLMQRIMQFRVLYESVFT